MLEPDNSPGATLEGNLKDVTDEAWLEAHEQLIAETTIPREQLDFVWEPDKTPEEVGLGYEREPD